MYGSPLVPDEFEVPLGLETDRLRLRPLLASDAVKDFEAVMTSAERLKSVFRPGGVWPDGLTLEQNLKELAWHEIEFQKRRSFAYTVVSLDESQVLGCLYLYPTRRGGHDVEVNLWVRASEAETGLDDHLYQSVRRWIAEAWPFRKPAYPGREIAWADWAALPQA
jgi:RimJ/RimL family protein N-acetyltransferase